MEKFDFNTAEGRSAYYKKYNFERKHKTALQIMEDNQVSYDDGCRSYYRQNYQRIKGYVRDYYWKNRDAMITKTNERRRNDRWKYKAYQALYYQRHKNEFKEKRLARKTELREPKSTILTFNDSTNENTIFEPLAIFTTKTVAYAIQTPITVKLKPVVHFD